MVCQKYVFINQYVHKNKSTKASPIIKNIIMIARPRQKYGFVKIF